MLQLRVKSSTRSWSSVRLASQFSQRPADGQPPPMQTTAMTPDKGGHSPSSILSRLSDRTASRGRANADTEQQSPHAHLEAAAAVHRKPHLRATSFIPARSARQRDHAAEKWFTNVRELDLGDVEQSNKLRSLPLNKPRGPELPMQHEMRPDTDLHALFASPTARSATSLRVQTKRELGGDYGSYLPDGYVDPYRLPTDYARLVLGRNKHIPLNAQTGALDIIEGAVLGRTTRQVV